MISFKLAAHANKMALALKAGLKRLNVEFAYDSPTNQQFIVLENRIVQKLLEKYDFEIWEEGKRKRRSGSSLPGPRNRKRSRIS